eukprot:6204090-Pleurochrysis_carterae.AAC.1
MPTCRLMPTLAHAAIILLRDLSRPLAEQGARKVLLTCHNLRFQLVLAQAAQRGARSLPRPGCHGG